MLVFSLSILRREGGREKKTERKGERERAREIERERERERVPGTPYAGGCLPPRWPRPQINLYGLREAIEMFAVLFIVSEDIYGV